jgi:hypothetical protein
MVRLFNHFADGMYLCSEELDASMMGEMKKILEYLVQNLPSAQRQHSQAVANNECTALQLAS